MVGRMSAGRCCCDEEPGGCLVFDDRDTDPGYSICSGSWTVDQTAGTYITESSDARLMFNDTISAGTKFRFYVTVTIEKTSTPFVGDAVVKLFGAASGCTGGTELILTVNYTGGAYDGGSVVLEDVDSDGVLSTSAYDLELCYDGSKLSASWYDPFESRITTRTFTPSSNQFGFGTGTLESGMKITFTAPRLEKATGGLCPSCEPSCCAGPVPETVIIVMDSWIGEWFYSDFIENARCYYTFVDYVEYNYFIRYDFSALNDQFNLTKVDTDQASCVWETTVDVRKQIQDCISGAPTLSETTETITIRLTIAPSGGRVATLSFVSSVDLGTFIYNNLTTLICELWCDPESMSYIEGNNTNNLGSPTATIEMDCGFAMPAKGYGIPKDPNTKPTPEPELPEDVKQWLMQQAPLSKTQSSSSESGPTKDADAQSQQMR